MVDLETLGTRPGAVIVSIGAVQFSDAGSLMHGLTIDPDTVAWWRQQSADTRGPVMDLDARCRLDEALQDFARFVDRKPAEEELWAKGPDFDLVLLEAAYLAAGLRKPWSYRVARDVRTLLALTPDSNSPRNPAKHHALRDAEYQAMDVIRAYGQLGLKLGEP